MYGLPSFLYHLTMVPSDIVGDRDGMKIFEAAVL